MIFAGDSSGKDEQKSDSLLEDNDEYDDGDDDMGLQGSEVSLHVIGRLKSDAVGDATDDSNKRKTESIVERSLSERQSVKAKFCTNCGTRSGGGNFCTQCGTNLLM